MALFVGGQNHEVTAKLNTDGSVSLCLSDIVFGKLQQGSDGLVGLQLVGIVTAPEIAQSGAKLDSNGKIVIS